MGRNTRCVKCLKTGTILHKSILTFFFLSFLKVKKMMHLLTKGIFSVQQGVTCLLWNGKNKVCHTCTYCFNSRTGPCPTRLTVQQVQKCLILKSTQISMTLWGPQWSMALVEALTKTLPAWLTVYALRIIHAHYQKKLWLRRTVTLSIADGLLLMVVSQLTLKELILTINGGAVQSCSFPLLHIPH